MNISERGKKNIDIYITLTRQCSIMRFFLGCENDNLRLKIVDSFLIAESIYCGYSLEPHQR